MNRIATVLLLLLASTVIADNAGDKAGFLAKVNQIRLEFAAKYNVPNMNELIWSQELAQITEKLDWNDAIWPEARKKWRYDVIPSYEDFSRIEVEMKKYRLADEAGKKAFINYGAVGPMEGLELVIPTQTVIGCGTVKNTGGKVVCLLGPETKFWNFWNRTSAGGPRCPKHYSYNNRMCWPHDKSKVSYFGFRDNFLPELNEIRRKYALDYQIPNMHELVWSEKLVKIGGSKSWEDEKWPDARITWRWVRLESYRNMSKEVTEARNNWSKMDEAGRNKWMKMNSGSYLGLELLEPKQTSIGCVPKWEGADVFLLCLIGNQGDHDSPGSDCMKGYRNFNGLCTSTLEKRRARSI